MKQHPLKKIGLSVLMMLTCSFSLIAGSNYSQEKTITLDIQNAPIKQIIAQIEKTSEFIFVYSDDVEASIEKKTSIKVQSKTITEILNLLLASTDLSYRIWDRQVVIYKDKDAKPVKKAEIEEQKSNIKVTGQIVDENGESLIGAIIQEIGTNNAAVSDLNGFYSIYNLKDATSRIKITYIGFKAVEVTVGNQQEINITLISDAQGLEEVVVVGYGSQKRESIVGAITTVRPSALQVNQTRTLSNALAGQVAGIIAIQRSGEPGYDSSDFWIRGINTFGAGTSPLVLVDGIERDLNSLSPEEIESFSILKDASATAIYGVRGANGVILVQTKRGQLGKPRIVVKADYGVSNPTQLPDFVDGAKYMEVSNAARILSGFEPSFSEEQINNTRNQTDPDLFPDVNWLKAVTRDNAPSMRASLDVNGGTDLIRYGLVVSYIGEDGYIIRDKTQAYNSQLNANRFNVRSNIDVNLTTSTVLGVGIGGYIYNRRAPGSISDILHEAFRQNPIAHPIKYSNGQLPKSQSRANPWADATQTGYEKNYNSSIQSNVSLEQDIASIWSPLKGMKAKVVFSFDNWSYSNLQRKRTPTYYWANGRDENGELETSIVNEGDQFLGYSKGGGGNRTMYFESQLNYNRRFGKHGVEGLFLFNLRDYVDADAGEAIMSLPYRNQGIAGRTAYNYNDLYFAEFNFGYNGSENFKKGYQYGFFPSIAAGWMVTNEDFMEDMKGTLSKLKLRGSIGQVGNDKIGGRRFSYLSTIDGTSGYSWGWQNDLSYSGYREGEYGIPDLTWETATKLNFGLEIGLWNSINLQADVFKEMREDILMERKTIPELAGFSRYPFANFGKVENQGIDMGLEINHSFTKDLFVSIRSNFTYARNKVIEFDEPETRKNSFYSQTGKSLNQQFGYVALGLFTPDDFEDVDNFILKEGVPTQFGQVKPGDIKYADLDGNGSVNELDQCAIGHPYVPEIVYGFGSSIKYKQFDLSFFFQGTGNFTNRIGGDNLIPGSGAGALGNIYANVDNRWMPEDPYNQNVFWPRLSSYINENNMVASTWWVKNSSFIRLKNAEIGYTIPKDWQKAMGIRHARLFMRGTNLLTFSDFDMWDPELGSDNGLRYPTQKIYSFGFELMF